MKTFYSAILIVFFLANQVVSLGCLDEHGNEVDYFIALRLPGKSPREMIKFDPNTKSFIKLSSENGGEQFLKQLFGQIDTKNHKILAFNDEHPHANGGLSLRSSGTAHAKGVLVTDQNGKGFYLQHSVPKFPAYDNGFNYVTPETSHFGQNYLCLRINNEDEVDQLRVNFTYMKASYYIDTYEKSKPVNQISLKESKNLDMGSFKIMSKKPDDIELLWDSIVEPYYQDSFLTETWGRPYSKDICRDNNDSISNIDQFKFDGKEYKHTLDHAKWGIALNKSIWCGSDMNRQDTQAKRGGSAICIENESIHSAFKSLIVEDGCKLVNGKQLSIIVE